MVTEATPRDGATVRMAITATPRATAETIIIIETVTAMYVMATMETVTGMGTGDIRRDITTMMAIITAEAP